jgi:CBS domain-containing protein/gamma-glutamylcysteine synthetase
MGDLKVRIADNREELNVFVRHLLKDIQALEQMLAEDKFEKNIKRIGAEQEICLIDDHAKPAPCNLDVLKKLNQHPSFTTELARFNIEANMQPQVFTGSCLSDLEGEILDLLGLLSRNLKEMELDYILTGILPTIRKFDLTNSNLTPFERYHALMDALKKQRGRDHYELKIEGIDELSFMHDSALVEACNTSFQVHLQVAPQDFVRKYNVAQAISAPMLSMCGNSPLLFGRRLWSETRIALFRQSVDTRVSSEYLRERSPRVTFGHSWLKNSIVDLYREDMMRFRILLTTDVEEDALQALSEGRIPLLRALRIHNSTVYRWNRACYGISDNGQPHLRIENRIFPAGPTVIDEVANAAVWLGVMNVFDEYCKDVSQVMDFDDARSNFMKAARSGLGVEIFWLNGKKINTVELLKKELLPMAREGLKKEGVHAQDIDKYIGTVEERISVGQTGSIWALKSFNQLIKQTTREEVVTAITAATALKQKENLPVHRWDLARIEDIVTWEPTDLVVEEFMDTDVITINEKDIPEFAADIMDWQRIRYLPVENEDGTLAGLITSRILLRYFNQNAKHKQADLYIKDLMIREPFTISPDATVNDAMTILREKKIGCLPVVKDGSLLGIITEANFLNITASLLKRIAERRKLRKNKVLKSAQNQFIEELSPETIRDMEEREDLSDSAL